MRSSSFGAFAGSLAALALVAACSRLTAPPSPEPIASDEPTSAAPNASGVASAVASAAGPKAFPTGTFSAPPPQPSAPAPGPLNEKLVSVDLAAGKGPVVKAGDRVSVNYSGRLADGKEFDSSAKQGKPIEFVVGQGRVIKGWDQGLLGMKVGGKRRLTIPPSLAYGDTGRPPIIPPKSTLTFDVELVEIKQ